MRVCVTGVAGFIGSHLADAIVRDGHEVVGFDNLSTGVRGNVGDAVRFAQGDLADVDAVRDAVRGCEVVFHQGALRSVPRSVDDPAPADRANVLGTLNVLIAARAEGVRRVVYASSSSVYGEQPQALRRESDRPNPLSPYAVQKLAAEQYCGVWTRLHGLSTVSLRYFNVFGPRQRPDSKYSTVFPAFVDALRAGRAPVVHWDGEQSRDFTHVEDVVRANLLAAGAGAEVDGAVINIGAGRTRSVNEVLRAVADALGTWIEPERVARRPGDPRETLADTTRAAELLGWKPEVAWEDGVRSVVDWFASAAR